MYRKKIPMRITPSRRLIPRLLVIHRSKRLPITMGRRKNSPTDIPSPSTTAKPTSAFWKPSLPSFFSSHWSNLDGFSTSPSSGERSADRISAFTPTMLEPKKLYTPRMRGHRRGDFSGASFRGVTSTVSPSLPRTTTASLSGPRIMIPSMSAWPPIMVLNFSCVFGCFVFAIILPF